MSILKPYKEGEPFYILSISGGGIRGMFPASVLARMEDDFRERKLCNNLRELFHLIVGTSTGSILAAGVACGIDADKINMLYKNCGDKMFRTNPWYERWFGRCVSMLIKNKFFPTLGLAIEVYFKCKHPHYLNDELKRNLSEILGTKKLSEVTIPLMIPTTTIDDRKRQS